MYINKISPQKYAFIKIDSLFSWFDKMKVFRNVLIHRWLCSVFIHLLQILYYLYVNTVSFLIWPFKVGAHCIQGSIKFGEYLPIDVLFPRIRKYILFSSLPVHAQPIAISFVSIGKYYWRSWGLDDSRCAALHVQVPRPDGKGSHCEVIGCLQTEVLPSSSPSTSTSVLLRPYTCGHGQNSNGLHTLSCIAAICVSHVKTRLLNVKT
jgi:hypothetical protein